MAEGDKKMPRQGSRRHSTRRSARRRSPRTRSPRSRKSRSRRGSKGARSSRRDVGARRYRAAHTDSSILEQLKKLLAGTPTLKELQRKRRLTLKTIERLKMELQSLGEQRSENTMQIAQGKDAGPFDWKIHYDTLLGSRASSIEKSLSEAKTDLQNINESIQNEMAEIPNPRLQSANTVQNPMERSTFQTTRPKLPPQKAASLSEYAHASSEEDEEDEEEARGMHRPRTRGLLRGAS